MSEKFQLEAAPRDAFGKGVARKLRAAGQTPGVVYGQGAEPLHISVDAHALGLIVRQKSAIIDLAINGEVILVQVKDVQKDPVLQIIEHIDLLRISEADAA